MPRAPATTCALVSTSPSGVKTKPRAATAGHGAAALVGALADRDRDDAGRRTFGNAGDDARIRIERGAVVDRIGRARGLRLAVDVRVVKSLDVEHERDMGDVVQARKARP